MIRGAAVAAYQQPRQHKRHVDLFDLCVWAYRDQMVDRVMGRGLFEGEAAVDEEEPHGISGCGCAVIERIQAIGSRIDGGKWAGLNDRVHPDAVSVERAVGGNRAIVEHARLGEAPEWPRTLPRAWPELADRRADQKWGRIDLRRYRNAAEWRAREAISADVVDYRILVSERVAEVVERKEWDGARRKWIRQQGAVSHDVEYCPLNWSPSIEWIMYQQGAYRLWHEAMTRLHSALVGVTFRDHVLIGFDAPASWVSQEPT